MGNIISYLILGFTAGILSGIVGIGGGVLIVPALVFLFGFSQQQAQGTTLALLVPPIGILKRGLIINMDLSISRLLHSSQLDLYLAASLEHVSL